MKVAKIKEFTVFILIKFAGPDLIIQASMNNPLCEQPGTCQLIDDTKVPAFQLSTKATNEENASGEPAVEMCRGNRVWSTRTCPSNPLIELGG